jgi:anti-anti-sigma factor
MKKIEFIEKDSVCIIVPHGEMTFFYLEELDEYIKEKIKTDQYKFIYDMKDVNWIDSMGLGLIAMTIKNALLNHAVSA